MSRNADNTSVGVIGKPEHNSIHSGQSKSFDLFGKDIRSVFHISKPLCFVFSVIFKSLENSVFANVSTGGGGVLLVHQSQ